MTPEEMKKVRADLGNLSQEKFGKILDVDSGAISNWENEKFKPSNGAAMMYKLFQYVIKIGHQKKFLSWLKK